MDRIFRGKRVEDIRLVEVVVGDRVVLLPLRTDWYRDPKRSDIGWACYLIYHLIPCISIFLSERGTSKSDKAPTL